MTPDRDTLSLVGVIVGVLLAGLLVGVIVGPSPCKHSVQAFSFFASCRHPDHTATITTEYGPVLLVCSCPEVTP